jgi:ankyrin repeat protein
MALFHYAPLDHLKQSIRLLRLSQGHGGFVECSLLDVLLHDPQGVISYEALSYTWDGTDKPYEIEVDGRPMMITSNLWFALQHLRYTHQDRILWIDAICIDQNNDKERGHQVSQMAEIYEQAERVLIWLGKGTPDTDHLFDHLTSVRQRPRIYDLIKKNPSEKEWLIGGNARKDVIYQHRSGLNHLLRQSWFNRVWIIQEVAKARSAQVLCGTRSASASDIAMLPLILGVEPDTHCQAILDIMPGASRKQSWWSQSRDLYTLLLKFRKSQASDPRDAIFALLGISSNANNTTILAPNYEKSLEEVIQDAIFFLLGFQDQECQLSSLPKWSMREFLGNLWTLRDGVLAWSAEHGEESVIKLLFDPKRVYPGSEIQSYQDAFLSAIKNGHEACVRLILETDKARMEQGNDKGAPLYYAAMHGHLKITELLLKTNQADVNLGSSYGKTPLFAAAKYGHLKITELLLNTKQAKVNVKEWDDKTPLVVAAEQGYDEIVKLLLKEPSILVDLRGNLQRTPLAAAVKNMHESTAKLLLDTKLVDVNSKDCFGKTSLLLATENGHTAMVKLLLSQNKIQVHITCKKGWAPIWIAVQSGHDDIFELLQEWETKNPRSSEYTTAFLRKRILDEVLRARKTEGTVAPAHKDHSLLMWAAMNGHNDIVHLLLEANLVDQDGRDTLLAWAMECKCTTPIVLLLKTGTICFLPEHVGRVVPLFEWAYHDGHQELLDLLLKSSKCNIFCNPSAVAQYYSYHKVHVG